MSFDNTHDFVDNKYQLFKNKKNILDEIIDRSYLSSIYKQLFKKSLDIAYRINEVGFDGISSHFLSKKDHGKQNNTTKDQTQLETYDICGQETRRGRPCQRKGKCPFHGKKY